jgi:hypothetical protein
MMRNDLAHLVPPFRGGGGLTSPCNLVGSVHQ